MPCKSTVDAIARVIKDWGLALDKRYIVYAIPFYTRINPSAAIAELADEFVELFKPFNNEIDLFVGCCS
jgi:hypothetical protein